MRLLRLRDLVLTVLCAAFASVTTLLVLGRVFFETLFETALGGKTTLCAAIAGVVAFGCGALYVLGKPPCARGGEGV